jgi:uncharacterized protein
MSLLRIAAALAVATVLRANIAQAAEPPAVMDAGGPLSAIVLQAYTHYVAGNVDGIIALTTDDVSWGGVGPAEFGYPFGTVHGHDGVRAWFAGLAAGAAPYQLTDLSFSEGDGTVTVTGMQATTFTASGTPFSGPFVHVFRFEGDRIAWFRVFMDTAAAVQAADPGRASEQAHIATIQRGYDSFARGDMGTLMDCFADDIVWETVGPEDKNPLFGTRHGKQEVMNWFGLLATLLEPQPFSDVRFMADGDTVVVTGLSTGTYHSTGRTLTVPFVHIMRFGPDGRVVALREHSDSWAEVDAYTAR